MTVHESLINSRQATIPRAHESLFEQRDMLPLRFCVQYDSPERRRHRAQPPDVCYELILLPESIGVFGSGSRVRRVRIIDVTSPHMQKPSADLKCVRNDYICAEYAGSMCDGRNIVQFNVLVRTDVEQKARDCGLVATAQVSVAERRRGMLMSIFSPRSGGLYDYDIYSVDWEAATHRRAYPSPRTLSGALTSVYGVGVCADELSQSTPSDETDEETSSVNGGE